MTELPPGLHGDVASAPISDVDLDRAIVNRLGLYGFIQVAWNQIIPGEEYSDNWHTAQVCAHLDAVAPARLIVDGLVINVPPGTGKSVVTCVAWPAHTWIWDPKHCWLYVSYSANLSARDARRCKELVDSRWYQERWPHVKTTGHKIGHYYTTAGGFRMSTSCDGQITGEHAHTRVFDDPIKPADTQGSSAVTRTTIDHVNKNIWDGTLSTRVKNPSEPAFAIIMQRLHDEDLAGYVMRKNPKVKHLRFPMRYEAANPCRTGLTLPNGKPGGDERTQEGELLWPGRYGESAVKHLESELNVFAPAQLQQRPSAAGGQIIKRHWLKYWTTDLGKVQSKPHLYRAFPEPEEILQWIQSWDMTFKDAAGSDYVCGQVWVRTGGHFFLRDRVYDRLSFPATCTAVELLSRTYPQTSLKLVEDKANGPAVIAWLAGKVPGLVPVEPNGSKLARLNAVSPFHRAGNVFYPDPEMPGYEWVLEHILDIIGFPMRRFDDTVDAESQALAHWLGERNPWLDGLTSARV